MVAALFIFALTLAGKLVFDAKEHFGRKTIDHSKEAAIVIILLVVASLAWGWKDWLFAGAYLLAFLSIFWAVFDSAFGLIIARNPFYLGTTSKLDRLQTKYLWIQVAKYVVAMFSVSFIVWKINNQ